MSKRNVKYTKGEIGKVKIVPDFLPSPDKLVLKEETVKVTLSLTKESVDFFKHQADINHTQYQKMIKIVLNMYALRFNRQRKRTKKITTPRNVKKSA